MGVFSAKLRQGLTFLLQATCRQADKLMRQCQKYFAALQ